MKKFFMLLMSLTLVFSVVGLNFSHAVDAKGYRSVKRSYQSVPKTTTPSTKQNSQYQSKTNQNTTSIFGNKSNTASSSSKGSFVKGLLLGGLGGMLFGSMFSHLGGLGTALTAMANILMLIALVLIVIKLFQSVFNNRKKDREVYERWKN
ncbi:hypothetical protein [Weizmannia acidilactici]|uniref:hypothetical protein n=1 Tax=Weizmannia acidilactici TaxID=2607726 RepID=UPI00124E8436|nr:hypothetical protein [Weizmannia acidilactici]GER73947.1 hypothetical protein BpPP18_20140 [Weizmannia acidilactici]